MYIITDTSSIIFTKDTNFSNFLLILDDYYKTSNIYEIENINTEEVIEK